jgi:AcrR family transcriptional regulator
MSGYGQGVAETRRRRANGEASRQRILDAAAQVAGERGYEGTSMNLVSERSGLPASSIYWHFKNKDELIAAVIDRSFSGWADTLKRAESMPADGSREDALRLTLQRSGRVLAEFPDFLRLGLMLILERRPDEPTARTKFLEVRELTAARTRALYEHVFTDLSADDIAALVRLTIATADGLFIARELEDLDLSGAFDLLANAVLGAAARLAAAG